jgi:hypothetical protein
MLAVDAGGPLQVSHYSHGIERANIDSRQVECMSDSRLLAPLVAKARRCIASDRLAVAEAGGFEGKAGEFALAGTAFPQILESERITQTHDIHADIAREEHSSRTPQQRDVSGTMSRSMDHLNTAGDVQYFAIR